MKSPNAEQLEALKTYASKHGRSWKQELLNDWLSGKDAHHPNGHLLRQVRNQFGPTWLNKFSLNA